MAYEDSGAEVRIDALYALARLEFIPARNHLAQQLRRAGERELGDQVKRLRKPSVAAWTLNQLRRRQPERIEGLLNAGLQLRQAQKQLLNKGERGLLRDAAARERRLVEETVQAAEAALREAGQTVSSSLRNKLRETTHAAALDPALGETLSRGRLVEDRQLSDLGLIGGLGSVPVAAPATGPATTEAEPAKPAPKNQRRQEQARQRRQKLEDKLQSALRDVDETQSQLHHAQTALRKAESEAARALSGVERGQAAAERARAAAEQAREQAAEAANGVDALEMENR